MKKFFSLVFELFNKTVENKVAVRKRVLKEQIKYVLVWFVRIHYMLPITATE